MSQLAGIPTENPTDQAGKYSEIVAKALQSTSFGPGLTLPQNLSREIINVVCVDGGATGVENGRTFATAYQTIQAGVTVANDGDYVLVRNDNMAARTYDEDTAAIGVTIDDRIFLVGETYYLSQPRLISGQEFVSRPAIVNTNAGATHVMSCTVSCSIAGVAIIGSLNAASDAPTGVLIATATNTRFENVCILFCGTVGINIADGNTYVWVDSSSFLANVQDFDCAGDSAGICFTNDLFYGFGVQTARSVVESANALFRECLFWKHYGLEVHHNAAGDHMAVDACVFSDMYDNHYPIISTEAEAQWHNTRCEWSNVEVDTTMLAASGTGEQITYVDTETVNDDLNPAGTNGFSITPNLDEIVAADSGRFRVAIQAYINAGYETIDEVVYAINSGDPYPTLTVSPARSRYVQGGNGGYRIIYQMLDAAVGGNRTVQLQICS